MADQQITTLLPKEYERGVERKPFAPGGRTLTLLVVILILAVLIYGGLLVFERYYLKKQLDEISTSEAGLNLEQRINDIKKVIDLDKKLDLLKQLLGSHIYFSQFFTFLEKNTETKVYFNQFSTDLASLRADVSGRAASYTDLAKQMKIFAASDKIKKVNVSGISTLPDGKINFKLDFIFDKSLLLKR